MTSSDSDKPQFKKLLELWNHPQLDDQGHKFNSPVTSKTFDKNSPKNRSSGGGDETRASPSTSDKSSTSSPVWKNQIERGLRSSNVSRLNLPDRRSSAPKSDSTAKTNGRDDDDDISTGLVDSDKYEEQFPEIHNTEPVRALVILEKRNTCELLVGESRQQNNGEKQLLISNLNRKPEGLECECSKSAFNGHDDLISFFLPQMGMACVCGRNGKELANPDEPTALENILRPWQVEFLNSFGIERGEQLVKARQRSPNILARGLRQWRKKLGMVSFRTSSCDTALCIWSKICKSYVRSIRRQILAGKTDFRFGHSDASLFSEMTQFLGDLPAAPKKCEQKSDDNALDIEPDSEIEV